MEDVLLSIVMNIFSSSMAGLYVKGGLILVVLAAYAYFKYQANKKKKEEARIDSEIIKKNAQNKLQDEKTEDPKKSEQAVDDFLKGE